MEKARIISALEKVTMDLELARDIQSSVNQAVFDYTDNFLVSEYVSNYSIMSNGAFAIIYKNINVLNALIGQITGDERSYNERTTDIQ